MALFKGRDADMLPLLTQFYQLEFDSAALAGSELDRWLAGVDRTSGALMWSASEFTKGRDPIADLKPLALAHPILRDVMDAIAEDATPSPSSCTGLNRLLEEMPANRVEWAETPLGVVVARYRRRESIPKEVLYALLDELVSAIHPILNTAPSKGDRPVFTRCQECRSAFLVQKTGQRFCSWRCAHRVNQRGKYKKPTG